VPRVSRCIAGEHQNTPSVPQGRRRRQRLGALVLTIATVGAGLSTIDALPADAANACGLPEIGQNVFMPGGNGEGLWTNSLLWSKNHSPHAGDNDVCIPGGTVALVNTSVDLVGTAVGYVTTVRIEGTIRVQGGAHATSNGVYGGTDLINGGVIQVLGNSRLDLNPDQNGDHAFQNIGNLVGGGQIQVQGGSSLYLQRPLLNNGTIDVTGGGELWANYGNQNVETYSGTGSVIGGPLRLRSGVINPTGGGALAVLATMNGGFTGTIGANQSVDVQCDTFSGGISMFGNVVNNGTIRFLPSTGGCGSSLAMNPQTGGSSLTNNGQFIVGDPNQLKGFGYFGTNPYQLGAFVNGPTGTVTLNDLWTDGGTTTNNGTWMVTPTGTYLGPDFTNNGTFVNNNGCDLRSLVNNGVFDVVKSCATHTNSTFGASSTLRLHASSIATTKITGGDRSSPIGGTLDVVTDAAHPPAVGVVTDILETGVTGTFAAVTSATAAFTYGAVYPSGGRPQLKLTSYSPGGAITAFNPARVLDTRASGTTVDGQGVGAGLQGIGATIEVQVAGRAGVPADASAAVLNVTVTETQAPGYVTVWPCGSTRPTASSLNFVAGSTVANGVISKIGDGGKVCLFVSNPTQLIVDVAGYFSVGSPYAPLLPARVLDTRGTGQTVDGQSQGGGAAALGSVTEVQITGRAEVPGDAAAAVLNVTVTEATAPGYLTVFPCGSAAPNASSLNYVTGSTVPNNVIAKIGAAGKVCLFTSQATHLIVDVSGYFKPGSAFQPLLPARVLETRPGQQTVDGQGQGAGLQAANSVVEVQVTGRAGVPAGAVAAVLNVTVTEAQGPGYVTVWPCGTDRPTASSLNFDAGSTVANGVIAKVGVGGKVCLFVSNGTQLIADVAAYFTS